MAIYGVTLLAACTFLGAWVGRMLGALLGLNSDIGGVGFSMVFLMITSNYLDKKNLLNKKSKNGIKFWSAMYVPIVVAMVMNQNVLAAISDGPIALLGGILAVLVLFPLIKPLTKLAHPTEHWHHSPHDEDNEDL